MTELFSFSKGDSPLLISIPHDGRELMPGQAEGMTAAGRAIPDTDWHVKRLYEFAADLGAGVIAANYSRYVIDLNRPADDAALYDGQVSTGLCPERTFSGDDIYTSGTTLSAGEMAMRIEQYWRPYHDKLGAALDELRERFGYALLWDAHSIAAEVPLLFEGVLPDLNIGTHDGRSCAAELENAVLQAAAASAYSYVVNGRFRGGYITRRYGDPGGGIHALQLELAQRTYMDERSLDFNPEQAARLGVTIRTMLSAFMTSAAG